jgi:hypothetical protein
MIKYSSHRENSDGSCDVGFNRPDGLRYLVKMPAKWKRHVLDWIKQEGIEIFLTKKFNYDTEYNKVNNIQLRKVIYLNRIQFAFDSFDGHIEIYNASNGRYSTLLDSLTDLFDLDNPKFTEPFKEKVEKEHNIKVKTIKVLKTRWDSDYEDVVVDSTWEEYNRNQRLNQLDI